MRKEVHAWISSETLEQLKEIAKQEGKKSVSELIRDILEEVTSTVPVPVPVENGKIHTLANNKQPVPVPVEQEVVPVDDLIASKEKELGRPLLEVEKFLLRSTK